MTSRVPSKPSVKGSLQMSDEFFDIVGSANKDYRCWQCNRCWRVLTNHPNLQSESKCSTCKLPLLADVSSQRDKEGKISAIYITGKGRARFVKDAPAD